MNKVSVVSVVTYDEVDFLVEYTTEGDGGEEDCLLECITDDDGPGELVNEVWDVWVVEGSELDWLVE